MHGGFHICLRVELAINLPDGYEWDGDAYRLKI